MKEHIRDIKPYQTDKSAVVAIEHAYLKEHIRDIKPYQTDKSAVVAIGQAYLKEHIRDIKSYQTDKSAVVAQVWEESHMIEAKLFKHIQNLRKTL